MNESGLDPEEKKLSEWTQSLAKAVLNKARPREGTRCKIDIKSDIYYFMQSNIMILIMYCIF